MDLALSDAHRALQHDLRRFLEVHGAAAPRAGGGRKAPDDKSRAWHRLLIEHGFLGRDIPARYGGGGHEFDPLAEGLIAEALADANVDPGIRDVGTGLIVPTLLEWGSEEQKDRWIASSLRADTIWCQGFSEPEAGSDLASLRTRAVPEAGHWRIDGEKVWTTSAQYARMICLLCRTEDLPGPAGLSCLLVPMDSAGIEVTPIPTLTGKASFNQVLFDAVKVPADALLGPRGGGWKVAATMLKHERRMLGSPDKAGARLRRIAAVAGNGSETVRATLSDPAMQDRLVRLQGEALAMKCHNLRLIGGGRIDPVSPLVGKYLGASLALRISEFAIDIFGTQALLYDPEAPDDPVSAWSADWMYDLGLTIGGGSAQIQKNIIAERGLGLPREARAG